MTAADLCRFTVVTPTTYADVAVPESARVGELVPRLVEHSGDRDLLGRPVVLQRMGSEPLGPDQTIRGSGVRDGETLHLRIRAEAIPPMLFDDLVDGVGRSVADGFGRWPRSLLASWVVAYATVPLVLGAVLLATEPTTPAVVAVAGTLSLLLIAAAGLAARAMGDRQVARCAACIAPLYAAVGAWAAGAVWLTGPDGPGSRWIPEPGQAAVTTATVLAVTLVTGKVIGGLWPPLAIAVAVALIASVAALASALWGTPVDRIGVTVAVVLMLAGPRVPTAAYRLARLAPPDLAQEPADLHSEIVTPLVGNEVLAQGRLADTYLTVLMTAAGLAAAAALVAASFGPGPARATAGLASAGFLLHSRLLRNLMQRVALIGAGLTGLAALGGQIVYHYGGDSRLIAGMVVSALATVAIVTVGRLVMPLRLSPVWGRTADLAETTVAVLSLPLLLWSHGLFALARGLAG